MNRSDILAEAALLTATERNNTYGPPLLNHERIAAGWRVILNKPDLTPAEVALCMAWVKIARLVETPDHLDSFVDGAAYMAIAGEISTEEPCPAPSHCCLSNLPMATEISSK